MLNEPTAQKTDQSMNEHLQIDKSSRTLLLVDDDALFLTQLERAMDKRGFSVRLANTVAEGIAQIDAEPPVFAVVDLRLDDGSGLDVVIRLKELRPASRAIILTGYGNIASAVSAVKSGAIDYLSKPVDADDIFHALMADNDGVPTPPEQPMTADRMRWEHILRVYELCDRNVSETARRLNMHRRTLQRILSKRAPL